MQRSEQLETDYLVIGSGAMAMAFVDTLLTESSATVTMIDKHHRPGGHWNDAYPFVRLHQPSAFYGVNSLELGGNTTDTVGINKGQSELAGGGEICGYFDQLMQKRLLPTGRLNYFPMCEYVGEGRFVSLVSGERRKVSFKKFVDGTHTGTAVPSTTAPAYNVDVGAVVVPINALPTINLIPGEYVVIGAGKTGMDACLWLLSNNVAPDCIRWVVPRDAWLIDRANTQPGDKSFFSRTQSIVLQMESAARAESIEHLFELLEVSGQLLRLDESVKPTMYRCAVVSRPELAMLRQIKNIVRLGRVTQVGVGNVQLEHGEIKTDPTALYIDCSADGLKRQAPIPVFDGNTITLQNVRVCQPTFSSAFIAYVEANYESDAKKNSFCRPISYPYSDFDWMKVTLATFKNQYGWSKESAISKWLANSRLDVFSAKSEAVYTQEGVAELLARYRNCVSPGLENLSKLMKGDVG